MADCRGKIRLHEAWWRRANPQPLVANFVPVETPWGGLDVQAPLPEIGRRKRANAAALAQVAQDQLVVQRIDFGPGFLPALAGAGFEVDAHTSWNTPVAERCAQVRIPEFRGRGRLWEAYVRRREQLLAHWSWDSYLPGHLSNVGPFDILAGLLGPGNLALEMTDDPGGVAELGAAAADFFAAVMRDEVAALRARGPAEGTTDIFSTWLPGRGIRMVEDFSALVGPRHTREFLLPAARRATQGFDCVLFHTHSAAYRNVPILAELNLPVAVEFGADPSGPALSQRIATVRRLQEAGLPVQFGSWQQPLADAEIAQVVRGLDSRGLFLRFQVASADDSARIRDLVLQLAETRQRENP